ncbi:MAG: GtrA family protein [Pseudomonadota bacterium]
MFPQLRHLIFEFLRFGVVGLAGFVVDTAVLYAGLHAGLGPYLARIPSYFCAASATFALNRAWTFRHRQGQAPAHRQWMAFLLLNLAGFALNYGTYALLVATVPLVAAHPVIGVFAGALAGMTSNFWLARRLVFTQ